MSNRTSTTSYRDSTVSIGSVSSTVSSNMIKLTQGFCVFNSLFKTSKFIETPISQLNTLARRLMWVDCKMGRIDYLTIPKC